MQQEIAQPAPEASLGQANDVEPEVQELPADNSVDQKTITDQREGGSVSQKGTPQNKAGGQGEIV